MKAVYILASRHKCSKSQQMGGSVLGHHHYKSSFGANNTKHPRTNISNSENRLVRLLIRPSVHIIETCILDTCNIAIGSKIEDQRYKYASMHHTHMIHKISQIPASCSHAACIHASWIHITDTCIMDTYIMDACIMDTSMGIIHRYIDTQIHRYMQHRRRGEQGSWSTLHGLHGLSRHVGQSQAGLKGPKPA